MTQKKVLVTGGAGFIGSNFVRHALQHTDWEVLNLDKLTYAGNLESLSDIEKDPRYRFVRGDIADRELVSQLFERERFDVVINFAAETHVDRSILDASPFIETNLRGTQLLMEAARAQGVSRFIQISTDEVYGSTREGEFTEESPLCPNSPYSASKAGADLLCLAYHRTYGLPVIITRSSNNYGPYQYPEKLIPLMIHRALEGETLPVYGKGENVRDWLYVEDNCQAIHDVVERGKVSEVYNIGGGVERRNLELVRQLCSIMADRLGKPASELEELIAFVTDRPGHDFRYALDCAKIRAELGWTPRVSLAEGLDQTVDWYRANQAWVDHLVTGEYQAYYARVYEKGWE